MSTLTGGRSHRVVRCRDLVRAGRPADRIVRHRDLVKRDINYSKNQEK